MTLTCDLDLELVDLWVLYINSLRRTLDQSLMKIFQWVREIWSRQESVMEGQTDGQTGEGHFYNSPSVLQGVGWGGMGGINNKLRK